MKYEQQVQRLRYAFFSRKGQCLLQTHQSGINGIILIYFQSNIRYNRITKQRIITCLIISGLWTLQVCIF